MIRHPDLMMAEGTPEKLLAWAELQAACKWNVAGRKATCPPEEVLARWRR